MDNFFLIFFILQIWHYNASWATTKVDLYMNN